MATDYDPTRPSRTDSATDTIPCLLTPMGRDGDPAFRTEHIIDAISVGILAFAAVILVDVVPSLVSGNPVFLTPAQILARIPTAAVAFLLAFGFMWAKARGIDALALLKNVLGE